MSDAKQSRLPYLFKFAVAALLGAFWAPAVVAQAPGTRSVTLVEVLNAVVAGHPAIDASQARLRAAIGNRSAAGALSNPMLSLQRESGLAPSSALGFGREGETMATGTLPLDFLYLRPARVRQADADVRSREADAASARTALLLAATDAYYQASLARVELLAARDLGSWLDSLVAYQRARVAEGAAAGLDLLRSELERDRVRVDIALLASTAARTRIGLASYLRSGDAGLTPEVTLPPERAWMAVPSDTLAWRSRPELRAARERRAAADAALSLEQRMLVPQLNATLGLKRIVGVNSLVSGFSLPLPLLNRNGGGITRARAARDEVDANLTELTRGAEIAAAAALESSRILTAQLEEFLARSPGDSLGYLGRAEQGRRIAMAAYREGGSSLLQLLDAARSWTDARVGFYRTLYAQQQSVISLLVAQGGDLSTTVTHLVAPLGAPR